jgi:ABC-type lipoprotein export system ATPase subunit
VSKIFYTKNDKIYAIKDAKIYMPRGSVVLVVGKNGSGKSTLLSLVCGAISPTSGRVYFGDNDISGLPPRFINLLRREKIGMIFQERSLIGRLTVIENLCLPLIPTNRNIVEIKKSGYDLLEKFGLKTKEKTKCGYLSGGEKQRLTIARALINNPDVILADEPTTYLDDEVLDVFINETKNWKKSGKTVVIASHQLELFDEIKPDILIELKQGQCFQVNL